MPIEVEKATRENVSYNITDEDGDEIDLTSAEEVVMRVSNDLNVEDEPVIEKEAGTVDSNGNATWNFKDSDTDISTGLYYFEIEIQYSSDQSTVPEVGEFFVRKRVEG